MDPELAIAHAILEHAGSLVLSPALPVAMPHVGFAPPVDGSAYLRVSLLPSDPETLGVGFTSKTRFHGLVSVDVFWPEDQGEIKPLEVAAAVAAHFPRGTVLWKEGHKVEFLHEPIRLAAASSSPWTMVPVRARYHCLAARG